MPEPGGCELLAVEEYGDGNQDWEGGAPLEKMPANLVLWVERNPRAIVSDGDGEP